MVSCSTPHSLDFGEYLANRSWLFLSRVGLERPRTDRGRSPHFRKRSRVARGWIEGSPAPFCTFEIHLSRPHHAQVHQLGWRPLQGSELLDARILQRTRLVRIVQLLPRQGTRSRSPQMRCSPPTSELWSSNACCPVDQCRSRSTTEVPAGLHRADLTE